MRFYTNVVRLGNEIGVRGVKDGQPFKEKIAYQPTVYIETNQESPCKNIYNKNLKPLPFNSLKECSEFCNEQKGSNLSLYGFPHHHHNYILEEYQNSEKNWNRDDVRIYNIDIEVYSAEGFPEAREAEYPITAICIHDSKMDKFIVFGNGEWKAENSELTEDLINKTYYISCNSEQQLIERFLRYWNDFPPDIVTGWNVEFFDMPYIHNRLLKLGFKVQKLSPWSHVRLKELETMRGAEQFLDIFGIEILDYLDLYRRRKIQDSYRLDNIAFIELGEKKLDYSEVAGLHQLYKTNYQKYIDYNIQDVNLVKRLDEKLGLIDAQMAFAYMACLNYAEVNSAVKTWDALINKELYQQNVFPHLHRKGEVDHNAQKIAGGYVKEPHIGKHGWCVSFDLNSLYPHLIMQFNISPETIDTSYYAFSELPDQQKIEAMLERKPHNAKEHQTVSASGHCFDNTFEGFIPRIMRRMYQERKAMKRVMLEKQKKGESYAYEDLRQFVLKISLNSGYGALANKYFRWYDNRLAESITLSGQLAIRQAEKSINDWMNKLLKTETDYVVAIDTDSNYVNMQPLVDKFFSDKSKEEIVSILDKVCNEQIQKAINDGYTSLAEYTNSRENAMVMEREAIASSAFWTAKKRYAMAVWDMEGVRFEDEPKIKIQGLEAIRSSTPASCRQPLLDIIKLTLSEDEETVQKYIAEFKEQFMSLPVEEIAMPRSINNLTKQTRSDGLFNKGTPPHVRGAIVFNRMLQKHKLTNWEPIQNGEKGKFIYLFQPNNVGTDVISFTTSIPDELDVKQYVDKHKMFEKVIADPVTGIFEKLDWTVEKRNTLTDFFS